MRVRAWTGATTACAPAPSAARPRPPEQRPLFAEQPVLDEEVAVLIQAGGSPRGIQASAYFAEHVFAAGPPLVQAATGQSITKEELGGWEVATRAGTVVLNLDNPETARMARTMPEAITYSLDDNAGGRFAINATTGEITVADGALLNYEGATSHGVTVRVTDANSCAQSFGGSNFAFGFP